MSCKVSELLMIDIKYTLRWSKHLLESYSASLEDRYSKTGYTGVINERDFLKELDDVLNRIDNVLYEEGLT